MKIEECIKFKITDVLPYLSIEQQQVLAYCINISIMGLRNSMMTSHALLKEENPEKIKKVLDYFELELSLTSIKNILLDCSKEFDDITLNLSEEKVNDIIKELKNLYPEALAHAEARLVYLEEIKPCPKLEHMRLDVECTFNALRKHFEESGTTSTDTVVLTDTEALTDETVLTGETQ